MSEPTPSTTDHGLFPSLWALWRRTFGAVGGRAGARRRSAAVLRLLAVSAAEEISAAPLLAAWARDERGSQAARVARGADLLAAGASPADVVDRVPGLVTADHGVAVRSGMRLGLLPEVVSATLAADAAADDGAWRRARSGLGYLAVVALVFVCVTALLVIKVIPQYRHIIREFGMAEPAALSLAASPWFTVPAMIVLLPFVVVVKVLEAFVDGTAPAGAVVVVTGLVILAWITGRAVVRFLGRVVGRRLAAPFLRGRRRAAALDHLGVAVAAGRPLDEAAAILAECQVDRAVAAGLRRVAAGGRVADLADAGLVTAAEQRFVAAAGAAGAEAWGLHTLARMQRDRHARRALGWSGTVVPVVAAVVMGALVLLEALAMFEPLVRLIEALA
ncbi:MAG: hypothetical protein ACKOCW_06535 [Planctomycetaceae bacterium]